MMGGALLGLLQISRKQRALIDFINGRPFCMQEQRKDVALW